MNYSADTTCMTKTEYENSVRKSWHSVKTDPPAEGRAVLILNTLGERDSQLWTTDIAYFCDGEFYYLELDPHLGILRKEHVDFNVEYWADYIVPDPEGDVIL